MRKLLLVLKKYLFILLFSLFVSCNQTPSVSQTKNPERKLEIFCDSFLIHHNNWKQNDIINEKANNDLQNDFSKGISNGVLSDFPLELKLINEYKPHKYAAHFSTKYSIETKYTYKFDVIALISKEDGEKLKTDSLYGLKGQFKKFLYRDFQDYTYGMAYSPKVQVKMDEVYRDSAAFDLGIILLNNAQFKIFK